MTPDISAATPRNAPCPCGSGLRYVLSRRARLPVMRWRCCASPPLTEDAAQVRQAQQCLEHGDWPAAESLCRLVLARTGNEPDALCIVGRAHSRRGEHREALRCLLAATRSASLPMLAGGAQFRVWKSVSEGFIEATFGLDHALALARRAEYDALRVPSSADEATAAPALLVTAVLTLSCIDARTMATLNSLVQQNYAHIELIVVHGFAGPEELARLAQGLRDCPLPHQVLAMPGAGDVAMLNAGVRAARGEYAAVVAEGDVWAVDRITVLVANVVNLGQAPPGASARWRSQLSPAAMQSTKGCATRWSASPTPRPQASRSSTSVLSRPVTATCSSGGSFSTCWTDSGSTPCPRVGPLSASALVRRATLRWHRGTRGRAGSRG